MERKNTLKAIWGMLFIKALGSVRKITAQIKSGQWKCKGKLKNRENQFGPLELIVENQISKWVKSVEEIRLGE